jgi:branched-chain amino acid transport system ATP-binding protein
MTSILQCESLCKSYGELIVTDNVSLNITEGELHAIIGPNGAGKTTLINQLSGELQPNKGTVRFSGEDVTDLTIHKRAQKGLLRSYQITSVFTEFTVRENIMLSALGPRDHGFHFLNSLSSHGSAAVVTEEIFELTKLGSLAENLAGELGYGERRQLELAMALAANPSFLLLDEPMAGMSVQESTEVIRVLKQLKDKYTILLIEHDMDAVFALADRISVLVYGAVIFTGTPEEIKGHPEVQAMYLGEDKI